MSGHRRQTTAAPGSAEALTCAADRKTTLLRCANCNAPICPECFAWTHEGLRCSDCAAAVARPSTVLAVLHKGLPLATALGVAILLAVVVLLLVRREEPEPAQARSTVSPPTQAVKDDLLSVDLPNVPLSMGIPAGWMVQPADAAGGAILAPSVSGSAGPEGWLRVVLVKSDEGVTPVAERVMGELLAGREGLKDVTRGTAMVAGQPAWWTRFTVPLEPDGTGPITEQTYYFVDVDGGVAVLAIVSTNAAEHAALVKATVATVRAR